MELKNSTILITGGTSGIGLELVKQLSELGATILVTGRKQQALDETRKQFPGIHTFQSDVSDSAAIERLYEEVTSQFPDLNILMNNAGAMRLIDLQDTALSLENVTSEIQTNLTGTIQMVHQFLPHLMKKKSAAVVNFSSAIAFMTYSSAPIYSASKSGVHAYTKALRLQLDGTPVKVFEVIPPGVNTNLQNDWVLQPNEKQMMSVDKMVGQAIKGLLKNKREIKPGLAAVVKVMSRIAPRFVERRLGHREFEKFKKLSGK